MRRPSISWRETSNASHCTSSTLAGCDYSVAHRAVRLKLSNSCHESDGNPRSEMPRRVVEAVVQWRGSFIDAAARLPPRLPQFPCSSRLARA